MAGTTDHTDTGDDGFTEAERAAMKERAAELRAQKGGGSKRAEKDLEAVLDAIGAMPDTERAIARRIHEIVLETAPELAPKTWYGMPAYARDGKVLVFFQGASKFDSRYSTLGFNDGARLDDGAMWPASFAIVALGAAEEKRIAELVRRAVG